MLLTDVQRFSIHDGPGTRTTVFCKGCPLTCAWCHNPETQNPAPEQQFFENKCIGCGKCSEGCYTGARRTVGEEYTTERLMELILRDKALYTLSGGGVTFSGGEPFVQSDALLHLLRRCKEAGIHTAVETAACVSWGSIEKCLPYIDLLYCDIKAMDDGLHRKGTGVSNSLILENIQKLAQTPVKLVLRTPVIPDFNEGEINAICDFVAALPGNQKLELLKYHNMGASKYKTLGRTYAVTAQLSEEVFAQLKKLVHERGLQYESD